jgi:hypothetical protein
MKMTRIDFILFVTVCSLGLIYGMLVCPELKDTKWRKYLENKLDYNKEMPKKGWGF